jgi:hypothetical protein
VVRPASPWACAAAASASGKVAIDVNARRVLLDEPGDGAHAGVVGLDHQPLQPDAQLGGHLRIGGVGRGVVGPDRHEETTRAQHLQGPGAHLTGEGVQHHVDVVAHLGEVRGPVVDQR